MYTDVDWIAIKNAKTQEELQALNELQMKRLLGTEHVIENVLKMLDCNPWDDLSNWPADAAKYKGMQLSMSKMKNEVNHREPRTISYDGRLSSYPILSTGTGWHSIEKRNRKSDIEDLGEGTNLYFKFLKYFMVLFFICTIISIPSIGIYASGMENDSETRILQKFLMALTLGNVGSYSAQVCNSALVPQT